MFEGIVLIGNICDICIFITVHVLIFEYDRSLFLFFIICLCVCMCLPVHDHKPTFMHTQRSQTSFIRFTFRSLAFMTLLKNLYFQVQTTSSFIVALCTVLEARKLHSPMVLRVCLQSRQDLPGCRQSGDNDNVP